jgi:hypothetical protein
MLLFLCPLNATWDSNQPIKGTVGSCHRVCLSTALRCRSACSLRLAAAAIRLRLRLLQYFSLYGLQLQQSKQLQQCRLAASRTRPLSSSIKKNKSCPWRRRKKNYASISSSPVGHSIQLALLKSVPLAILAFTLAEKKPPQEQLAARVKKQSC